MIRGLKIKENDDTLWSQFNRDREPIEETEDYQSEENQSKEEMRRDVVPSKGKVSRRGFLGALGATAAGAAVATKVKAKPASSFEVLDTPPPPVPKGRQYITTSTQPDKFTIVRKRELLTPSRCTVMGCQFDIAKKNGYPEGWETVPHRERRLMVEALKQHVVVAHNRSEDYIIDESVLPKRWLSAERGLKDL